MTDLQQGAKKLYSLLLRRLPESEFKYGLLGITPHQLNAAVVIPHNLPGDRETDAGAFLFGGV